MAALFIYNQYLVVICSGSIPLAGISNSLVGWINPYTLIY